MNDRLLIGSVVDNVYAGPMLRELPPDTLLYTDRRVHSGGCCVRLSTFPNVHTLTCIGERQLLGVQGTEGGLVRLLDRTLRGAVLRHFAAWSVGAYPGWRL